MITLVIAYWAYYVPGLNEVHHYSIISQAFNTYILLVGPFLDGNLAITILSVYVTQPSYPTSGNLSSINTCSTCSFSWKGLCKDVNWSTICKLVKKNKTQKFQCPVLPEKWQNKSWFMCSWEVINNERSQMSLWEYLPDTLQNFPPSWCSTVPGYQTKHSHTQNKAI